MKNDKMSFFEKLTGGVKIKNEDTPSYVKQQKQLEVVKQTVSSVRRRETY